LEKNVTNAIVKFMFEDTAEIRTDIDEQGRPLVCASDVAVALGYGRPQDAVRVHCRDVVTRTISSSEPGRPVKLLFILEPDLYRLIVRSCRPEAQRFERWIFEEVLPAIRKTGSYSVAKVDPSSAAVVALEARLHELEVRQWTFVTGMLSRHEHAFDATQDRIGKLERAVKQIKAGARVQASGRRGGGERKTLPRPVPPLIIGRQSSLVLRRS
jgi:prophage antirepressor-like protein